MEESYHGIEFIRDLMRESDTPSGSIMPVVFTYVSIQYYAWDSAGTF